MEDVEAGLERRGWIDEEVEVKDRLGLVITVTVLFYLST